MLSASNIRLSFGPKLIFNQVSFSLLQGERVALVGQNGAGKSTFLKVLAGEHEPDEGSVDSQKRLKIGYLTQEPKLELELGVVDALRKNFYGEDYRLEEILNRLRIKARHELVKTLSGGERRRVDLARVLLEDPDLFLLDEPTNHLDLQAIQFLVQYFTSTQKPVLFISHDSRFIDEVATRILELDSGKFYVHDASYMDFLENKLVRTDIEGRTLHKKDRLVARELVWLRAGTPARTTKQSARISRAQDLITEVGTEFERTRAKKVEIENTKNHRLAKTILEFKQVSCEPLFRELNLIVTQGQRYGILGPNGAGKTTLLNLISGTREPTSGQIIRGLHTQVVQFDQNRNQLNPEASLKETLADQGDMVFVGDKPLHIASYLERYLFSPADQNRKVSTLSGGEQNRLLLAKLLKQGANCLLLDEPTNDLDVTTLGILEEMLDAHEGVAFIVSHDRRFLDRVCTSMLVFEEGSITEYAGSYSTYERLKQTEAVVVAKTDKQQASPKSGSKKKRSYNEEREFAGIEAEILKLEGDLAGLELRLSDPEACLQYAQLDEKIKKLYDRWQYLESIA